MTSLPVGDRPLAISIILATHVRVANGEPVIVTESLGHGHVEIGEARDGDAVAHVLGHGVADHMLAMVDGAIGQGGETSGVELLGFWGGHGERMLRVGF